MSSSDDPNEPTKHVSAPVKDALPKLRETDAGKVREVIAPYRGKEKKTRAKGDSTIAAESSPAESSGPAESTRQAESFGKAESPTVVESATTNNSAAMAKSRGAEISRSPSRLVGILATIVFVGIALFAVKQNAASIFSGVRYSGDEAGYQLQAEQATSKGNFDTAEEAWRLAIESAINEKMPAEKLAVIYTKAADSIGLRPDPSRETTLTDMGSIGPMRWGTDVQSMPLMAHYYKNAARLSASVGNDDHELEALTRLSFELNDRDRSDNRQIYLRMIDLGKGKPDKDPKDIVIPAYNHLAQLEVRDGNSELAKQYLEKALLIEQQHVNYPYPNNTMSSPNVPFPFTDLDTLIAIYVRENNYKEIARVLRWELSPSGPRGGLFSEGSTDNLTLLAKADRKLGNIAEAEKYEKIASDLRRRIGPQGSD